MSGLSAVPAIDPIPVKKPGTRTILIMVAIGAVDFIVMLWLYIMKLR